MHIGVVFSILWKIYNAQDVLSLICLVSLDIQVCVVVVIFSFLFEQFSLSYHFITSSSFHISEQGRRNDLIVNQLRPITLASNDQLLPQPPAVSSDSVHCNALTQASPVSYAFSCHTTNTCGVDGDVESSLASAPLELMDHNPSWVHVFSKTNSTSSLRTQCASSAYMNAKSSKVLHRRSR